MRPSSAISAGLLMFRRNPEFQVLLAHPGGPYWKNKDEGAWTIPKGLLDGQEPLEAAQREFQEETGFIANGPFIDLGTITQKSGKVVHAWAFEGEADTALIKSNEIEIEYPPNSGKRLIIPEVDRCEWFSPEDGKKKINPAQRAFVDRLVKGI